MPNRFLIIRAVTDCLVEARPLRILERSHCFGIQQHQRENLHVPEIPVDALLGDEWVEGELNAGEALSFNSLTVHAAPPNVSEQMRFSLESSFRDADRVLNRSNLVFAGESGKSGKSGKSRDKTYANWRSDEQKFSSKSLHLTFKPSREELEQLAETSESPSARATDARIVGQRK